MSHLIHESNDAAGNRLAEAAYACAPAWHELGTVLPDAPNGRAILAASRCDRQVIKRSLAGAIDSDGRNISTPSAFSLGRYEDDGAWTGWQAVGKDFQVVQATQAVDFLDSLHSDGVLKYEACFALRGGRNICILARLPSIDYATQSDASLRYILFDILHGYGSCKITACSTRVVCANTQRVAFSEGNPVIKINHNGTIAQRLENAKGYLETLDVEFTRHARVAQQLAERRYTPVEREDFVSSLYPVDSDTMTAREIAAQRGDRASVQEMIDHSTNSGPEMRGTFWQLVNGVTGKVDHRPARRERKDVRLKKEGRFRRTVTGDGAATKAAALQLAADMSGLTW